MRIERDKDWWETDTEERLSRNIWRMSRPFSCVAVWTLTVCAGPGSQPPPGRRTGSCDSPHSRASLLSTGTIKAKLFMLVAPFVFITGISLCLLLQVILRINKNSHPTFFVLGIFLEAFLPGSARSNENLKLEFTSKPDKWQVTFRRIETLRLPRFLEISQETYCV